MKKIVIIFILFYCTTCFGQGNYHWNGLTVGESTAEDVIKKMGKPNDDKKSNLSGFKDDWLSKDVKENKWRVFNYEDLKTQWLVRLGFDDKDKLVYLFLKPKELSPNKVLNSFNVTINLVDGNKSPKEFKKSLSENSDGVVLYNKYQVIGVNSEIFSFIDVDKSGEMRIGKQLKGLGGQVKYILLVSRSLCNKETEDIY
ncbi:MAG TPA: hypothetical protein PKY59_24410 [Pyrinomonadaceae bacterium]|nr:hypothetical protein [Pyrinomonadaceae bacterium]